VPIAAKVIADSVTEAGHRLTTIEATFHRFILAEVNTHRVLSRNSASSRARPVEKVLQDVMDNPAIPVKWASRQRGMSGGDEIFNTWEAESTWLNARDLAVSEARKLLNMDVHKSIVNRLLEPFSWHTAILSGTSWGNLIGLRANPTAQPEFQELAYKIQDAINGSIPQRLDTGEWHTPYITEDDEDLSLKETLQVSAARCARVSYLTHDGQRNPAKDLELYERLVSANPKHSSPLEHVATPWPFNVAEWDKRRQLGERPKLGNLIGWRSLRLDVEAREGVNSYQ